MCNVDHVPVCPDCRQSSDLSSASQEVERLSDQLQAQGEKFEDLECQYQQTRADFLKYATLVMIRLNCVEFFILHVFWRTNNVVARSSESFSDPNVVHYLYLL